ncbi:MAG: hypothetical protein ABIO70_06085, partial [Pseudomonadota bacterium]
MSPQEAPTLALSPETLKGRTKRRQRPCFGVELLQRVERTAYLAMASWCKARFGWVGWGKSRPTVFWFREETDAQQFRHTFQAAAPGAPPPVASAGSNVIPIRPAPVQKVGAVAPKAAPSYPAERLRELGRGMIRKADETIGQRRQENTHRRARIAAGVRREAYQQKLVGERMLKTVDAVEAGRGQELRCLTSKTLFEELETVRTLMRWNRIRAENVREEAVDIDDAVNIDHAVLPGNDPAASRWRKAGVTTTMELRELVRVYHAEIIEGGPQRQAEDPLKVINRELIGARIPGYFPTPDVVVAEMMQFAAVEAGHTVLEPSAGSGHIARAIRAAGVEPYCVEFNFT